MNINSLSMTIVLLLFSNSMESASFQRCDPVPRYLDKIYQSLTIGRNCSGINKGLCLTTSSDNDIMRKMCTLITSKAIPWRNSSLRMYFNLSSLASQTQIYSADLILYRTPPSFIQTSIYQQSYGLILKDINTSTILYNRTLASGDRSCLVKNVLNLVRRWQKVPESNQGLLLTVKDTGRYSTTLETFYPKKNIKVPALALLLKPRKNFLKRYRLILSQVIEILKIKT